ncbi:MAG: sigma 54-interacting transcriptional regulator [Clostridia bacterium]|nr:sigma 54-interacting transcriptional regulator [Deltaproteobacteria bacterium]
MLVSNRYRVLQRLGSGSMAIVVAVHDTWTQREVALKLPRSPEASKRLARERMLLHRFAHPAIMRIYGDGLLSEALEGVEAGHVYSVVELCAGCDAKTWAKDKKTDAIAALGARVAAALAALHTNGVRHGDVTPDNLRVRDDGVCKLIDFSLGDTRLASTAAGTMATMAPEALAGNFGAPADVYALASTHATLVGVRVAPGAPIESTVFGEALAAMSATRIDQRIDAAGASELLARYADDATRAAIGDAIRPAIIVGRDELIDSLVATPGRHVIGGVRGSGRTTVLEACALATGGTVLSGASGSLSVFGDVPREKSIALAQLASTLSGVILVDDVPEGSPLDELGYALGRQNGVTWVQSSIGGKSPSPLTRDEIATLIHASRPLRPHDRHAADALHAVTSGHPGSVIAILEAFPSDHLMSAAIRKTLAVPNSRVVEPLVAVASLFPHGAPMTLLCELTTLDAARLGRLLDAGTLVARNDRVEAPHRAGLETLPVATAHELVRLLDPRRDALALVRAHVRIGEREIAGELAAYGGSRAEADLRHDEALAMYQAAMVPIDLGPSDSRLAMGCARMLLVLGRAAEALEALQQVKVHPERRVLAGEALLALGRYSDAAEMLENSSAPEEPLGRIAATRARALMLAGRYDEARAFANASLPTAEDKRVELMNVAGVSAFYLGAIADARATLSEALALASEPKLVESTRANLALVLHKAGDTRAAEAAYVRCIEELSAWHDLPRKLLRLVNLATLRQEIGAAASALTSYTEAAELARLTGNDRALVRVQLNQANLLVWLGAVNEARTLLGEARATAEAHKLTLEAAYLRLVEAEANESADIGVPEQTLDAAGQAEATLVRALAALRVGSHREAYELARLASDAARHAQRERLELRASVIAAIAERIPALARHAELVARCTDPDLAWIARVVLHRATPDDALLREAKRDLASVRSSLPARYSQAYAAVWWRAPLIAELAGQGENARQMSRDVERLLAINRELARDHDPERLLERIIDAAIALSGAERGFLLLCMEGEEELGVRTARGTDARELTRDELDISRSIAREVIISGSPLSTIDAQHDDRFRAYQSVHALRLRSVLCLPLRTGSTTLGVIYLDHRYRASAFDATDVALLSAFGDQAAIAIANARTLQELERRSNELEASRTAIDELNQRLSTELHAREAELATVRQSTDDPSELGRHGLIGRSPQMREVFRVIDRVGDKDVAVAITGESGTGKELVARAIHAASKNRRGPFVPINCGAIAENLLESELFGHERGAFTGAVRAKPGLFEIARNGTLFLDEIGDMPLGMQVKLLRVLQSREFRRVGGTVDVTTNARIISATNRDLESLVRSGGFREDLWYRLNVVELHLPALRDRKPDLPLLINHLLDQHARGVDVRMSRRALAALLDYDWPGNVRELDNELQRAVALSEGTIEPDAFSAKLKGKSAPADDPSTGTLKMILDRQERAVIKATLDENNGRVAAAARALGLTRAGLYKKLHKYGLASARDD